MSGLERFQASGAVLTELDNWLGSLAKVLRILFDATLHVGIGIHSLAILQSYEAS